jgi:CheY-like chemotaxis protein
LVARILVADDNSNIQKMVGLALKDQGIDVVAVGNGEAAVRKISDIKPDLVLADVFMPVRNGYEVCQYVKSDSALAHIPVILLVGAFDPLDEQEAQRVGADGVLKKPFVPPDPLISMVKSALARAGVHVGGGPPLRPAHQEPIRVAEMLTPRVAPASQGYASTPASLPELPAVESEPFLEELPALPELPQPVKIDAGSQPVAFGSLLETKESEQEEDLGYATTAQPELERDWKAGEEEEEEAVEEEEPQSAGWRRGGGDESSDAEEPTGPVKDWRETAFSEAPARKGRSESWAPQKEKSNFQEAAETEQSVGGMAMDAPVGETRIAPAAAAPYTEEAWASALDHKPGVKTATMEPPAPAVEKPKEQVAEVVHAEPGKPAPQVAPEPVKPAESAWFSAVSSPWDTEVQKANRLASTWDAPTTSEQAASSVSEAPKIVVPEEPTATKEDPAATVDTLPSALSKDVQAKVEEAALPAATVEVIREEAQIVTETAVQEAPPARASEHAAEPSMEDMVAKVLSKMSPEMLQAVTREILKPVVEAMVRDELNAKK